MKKKPKSKLVSILREQIQELRALIALKDQRIQELEKRPAFPWTPEVNSPVTIPYIQPAPYPWPNINPMNPIIITCQHEYPNPWLGTVPPSCLKCGQQAQSAGPIFVTGTNIGGGVQGNLVATEFLGDVQCGAGSGTSTHNIKDLLTNSFYKADNSCLSIPRDNS